MKNIYFYIYAEKQFAPEYELMSKLQIENSLNYFAPDDVLVVTNFAWEYKGIKAHVVGDELTAKVQSHGTSLSNKPLTAIYLIENGLVGDINWFHDWDIYQLAPLDIELERDLVLVEHTNNPRLSMGSLFFKPEAHDVFEWLEKTITDQVCNEEDALNSLTNENFNNILDRFTLLDPSYNIGMPNLIKAIEIAEKPLHIAHFPPYKPYYLRKAKKITPSGLRRTLSKYFAQNNDQVKNLLVYISPKKRFNPEHELMARVQIENSLTYFSKDDIILLTNFPYEYNGVKAIEAPDRLINKSVERNARGIINSKVDAMIYLIENNIVNGLTWFHDFDSFQLSPLNLPQITKDLGVVCYGIYPKSRLTPLGKDYPHRINFGNVFFKPQSLDILKLLLQKMADTGHYEEDAMTILFGDNPSVANRVQIMDQTYNIGMRYVRSNVEIAAKPLRVAHFPPHWPQTYGRFKPYLPKNLMALINDRFYNGTFATDNQSQK